MMQLKIGSQIGYVPKFTPKTKCNQPMQHNRVNSTHHQDMEGTILQLSPVPRALQGYAPRAYRPVGAFSFRFSLGARRSRKRGSAGPLSGHSGPGEKENRELRQRDAEQGHAQRWHQKRIRRDTGGVLRLQGLQAEVDEILQVDQLRDFRLPQERTWNEIRNMAETVIAKIRGEDWTAQCLC